MIKVNEIRDRLAWADEFDENETAERFAVWLAEELAEIPEDEPGRMPTAIRKTLLRWRVWAWRSCCMAFMGAENPGRGDAE
jgi:hypothetical protein